MSPETLAPAAVPHAMQCMEVWGGNRAMDNAVTMPGLDAWIYSQPYHEADGGGDVHYVSSCATGRISRLLVADVSGHGAPVSNLARELRTLMVRHSNYIDQTKFVQSLNRQFTGLAHDGTFATAVVATYWAPTDYLTLCNAGHPRPLWWRSKTRRWQYLAIDAAREAGAEPTNLPLGILEPTGYEQFGVRLSRGDVVVIYTDSLTEAASPDGRLLGEDGLLELARGLDPARAEDLIPSLLRAVAGFRAGAPSADDITVLLVRHNGARPPRMGLGDWARAMRRFIALAAERLRGGAGGLPWPELRLAAFGAFWTRLNDRWGRPGRDDRANTG